MAELKNYFWDIYLRFIGMPKPEKPGRLYRHLKDFLKYFVEKTKQ